METISLQPMTDQEIDLVSGGFWPQMAYLAFRFAAAFASGTTATVLSNYLWDFGVRVLNNRDMDMIVGEHMCYATS